MRQAVGRMTARLPVGASPDARCWPDLVPHVLVEEYLMTVSSVARPTRTPLSIGGAVLRVAVGLLFVMSGLPKLGAPASEVDNFDRWGVPLAEVAVPATGALEAVCGLALALGVLTRIAAVVLAAIMVGAFLTAGLTDGVPHTVLPPVLAAICAVVVWRGGGAFQLLPQARGVG
jgi:putative oxidoreductase